MKWLTRRISLIIIMLTHRMWNRRIYCQIIRLYDNHTITSAQLHTILARFDPTQESSKALYQKHYWE